MWATPSAVCGWLIPAIFTKVIQAILHWVCGSDASIGFSSRLKAGSAALTRELKGQLDLQQPGVIAGCGPYGVVIRTEVQLHGLPAKVKPLADVGADWDGPLAAARDPVRRDFRRRAGGPSVGEMIVDEGIQKELVGAARPTKRP